MDAETIERLTKLNIPRNWTSDDVRTVSTLIQDLQLIEKAGGGDCCVLLHNDPSNYDVCALLCNLIFIEVETDKRKNGEEQKHVAVILKSA